MDTIKALRHINLYYPEIKNTELLSKVGVLKTVKSVEHKKQFKQAIQYIIGQLETNGYVLVYDENISQYTGSLLCWMMYYWEYEQGQKNESIKLTPIL